MLKTSLDRMKKKDRTLLIKKMSKDFQDVNPALTSPNPAIISERLKDVEYINRMADSWNPAQLNEALEALEMPLIDSWNPQIIEEQRRLIASMLAERYASGDVVTIIPPGIMQLVIISLTAEITPIQSGSGTPSPSNVRPITGHDSEVVTISNDDETETNTLPFPSTIYGGEVKVSQDGSAELTNDSVYWDFTNCTRTNDHQFYINSNVAKKNAYGEANIKCDKLPTLDSNPGTGAEVDGVHTNSSGAIVFHTEEAYTTKDAFLTAMGGTIGIWCKRETPQTITLTPQTIEALQGENNVSASTGMIKELKYKFTF